MDLLAGPYAVAAVLLVVAGALEVARPGPTVGALARVGVMVPAPMVRGLAAVGAFVGLVALLAGGGAMGRAAAAAVAVAYAGFAAFTAIALVRGEPGSSCGCFGRDDTPPSRTHLVLDVVAVIAATAVARWPGDGFPGAVAHQPGAGIPFLLVTMACACLAYAAFTLVVVRVPRG